MDSGLQATWQVAIVPHRADLWHQDCRVSKDQKATCPFLTGRLDEMVGTPALQIGKQQQDLPRESCA
jgi:hypothetical protein